jgi:cytochrome c553
MTARTQLLPILALTVTTAWSSAQTVPFSVLDNVEGSWVNLNAVPIRPMVRLADNTIYAVNTHRSTVERFAGATTTPLSVFPVPWAPVSIALWSGQFGSYSSPEELLVVCRSTYSLVRLERATGKTLRILELPTEPGDILVDEAHGRAFISCSGADAVVQVDLATNVITRTYSAKNDAAFQCKHPLFLSFDAQGKVLVAPLLSGNNSTPERDTVGPGAGAREANDKVLALTVGAVLPDVDLLQIDPNANPAVNAVAKGTGSVLFAHGTNPQTGKLWQLNTQANNAVPNPQSEPGIRGNIVKNALTITTPTIPAQTVHTFVDLDTAATGSLDPLHTVGQPYALAFKSNGNGFITGLLTDRVTVLDQNGAFVGDWFLVDGAIPRGILLDSSETVAFVYCWGTNQIRTYRVGNHASLVTYALSYDPAPASIQAGRALFYDASHSLHNNASCATCHIEGRTDMLAWTLSDLPKDDKGPLITQTLAGIEKLAPFHWRGERPQLIDFNAAFDGLLGGAPLAVGAPTFEFDNFQKFVFSIQNPANPNENSSRVVDPAIASPGIATGIVADATAGQQEFQNTIVFGGLFACADCHALPTGTSGDIFNVNPALTKPKRSHLKITPYNELWRKQQPTVFVDVPGEVPSTPRALLGGGVSHAGLIADLASFVSAVGDPVNIMSHPQQHADVTSFVYQIDQGLAPAVHRAFHLSAATVATVGPLLQNYLATQVANRNCDVAVIGTVSSGSTVTPLRWAWDRSAGLYRSETNATRTLQDFLNAAPAGNESYVFVALPVGMAEHFAIDEDLDGLLNGSDPQPLVPDTTVFGTTPPQVTLGPNVQWVTARAARLRFETDQPATYTLTATTVDSANVAHTVTMSSDVFSKVHTPVITGLLPSTPYTVPAVDFWYSLTLTVTGRAGTWSQSSTGNLFKSGNFTQSPLAGGADDGRNDTIVSSLDWATPPAVTTSTTPFDATANVIVDFKQMGPPALHAQHRVAIATVLVNGVKRSDFVPTAGCYIFGAIQITGGNTLHASGAFLVSDPTDATGLTHLGFQQPNLVIGTSETVTLNIEAILEVTDDAAFKLAAGQGGATLMVPTPGARAFTKWSFPDTPKLARSVSAIDP